MKSFFGGNHTQCGFPIFVLLLVACSQSDEIIPKPFISITSQSVNYLNESISGQVHGVEPRLYKIAVYAKIKDGWYNLPNREFPLLSIAEDKTWMCNLGAIQINQITEFNIYLLPNGYSPPVLIGTKTIPLKMNLVSAARKNISLK